MPKEFFITREKGGDRAVLVQCAVYQAENAENFESSLQEFRLLSLSAQAEILNIVVGKLQKPHPKYFVGEGKAQEIAETVRAHGADLVLFNHTLSPAQSRNLEQLFGCRVCDRAELILDIFAQRARTFEGKLQVELAQLQHISTRLVRGWTHLERQKGGIGLRGPGETQLETDRRLVAGRIKNIKKRLEKVEKQREQSRRARTRAGTPVVSIVGYTNAGKSTLFNRITESDIYAADQLFATLDTTCRQLIFPKIGKVIVADTVGFVRQLPHELVAAFKATLEETREADLLLHVVDASTDEVSETMTTVNEVLSEIQAGDIPQLIVMNKIDLLKNFLPRIDYDAKHRPKRVWISSQQNLGMDLLLQAIEESLVSRVVNVVVTLTSMQGKLRAQLYALGVIQSENINDNGDWVLSLEIQEVDFRRLFAS